MSSGPWRTQRTAFRRALLRLLAALASEQNDTWHHQRSIVEPTFIEPEIAIQRAA